MKRNYFNHFIIITMLFILSGIKGYGQISTDERPVSFSLGNAIALKANAETVKSLPSIDMVKIRQEDMEDEQKTMPPITVVV